MTNTCCLKLLCGHLLDKQLQVTDLLLQTWKLGLSPQGRVHVPSRPCPPCRVVPESCELHLLVVIGDELGDEAEVGNLRGSPAKLEDDNEGSVVDEGGPLRCGWPTAQAGAEDEREGE